MLVEFGKSVEVGWFGGIWRGGSARNQSGAATARAASSRQGVATVTKPNHQPKENPCGDHIREWSSADA
jgi:hypothetical protein